MRIIELGNLLAQGFPVVGGSANPIPDGDYIGWAIGPDSTVDLVRIDGVLLGPGRVLPCTARKPIVEAVRGVHTGGGMDVHQPCGRAQLIAYECGDVLVPPGPRPPFVLPSSVVVMAAAPTDPASRYIAASIPFSGRKMAMFCIRIDNPGALTYTAYVRGFKYQTRARALADIFREPHEAVVGTTVLATNFDAFTGIALSNVFYVGGTDSAELYDELQLEIGATAGVATPTFYVDAEAYDTEGGL